AIRRGRWTRRRSDVAPPPRRRSTWWPPLPALRASAPTIHRERAGAVRCPASRRPPARPTAPPTTPPASAADRTDGPPRAPAPHPRQAGGRAGPDRDARRAHALAVTRPARRRRGAQKPPP